MSWCRGSPLQVETPRVPTFEAAVSQAEWDALHEQRRAAEEEARKVGAGWRLLRLVKGLPGARQDAERG
jgi:hypothetical protein